MPLRFAGDPLDEPEVLLPESRAEIKGTLEQRYETLAALLTKETDSLGTEGMIHWTVTQDDLYPDTCQISAATLVRLMVDPSIVARVTVVTRMLHEHLGKLTPDAPKTIVKAAATALARRIQELEDHPDRLLPTEKTGIEVLPPGTLPDAAVVDLGRSAPSWSASGVPAVKPL